MGIHYKGPYSYNNKTVADWESSPIGVYYCGTPHPTGDVSPLYVGRAIGDGGIRTRLLQHLAEDKWPDVTHFSYTTCDSSKEAIDLEAAEITRIQPKYNKQLL